MALINNIDPLFTSEGRDRDEEVSREVKTGVGLLINTVLIAYFNDKWRNWRETYRNT